MYCSLVFCVTVYHIAYDVLYDGKANCCAHIFFIRAVECYTFMTLDTVVSMRLNEFFTIFCPFSLMTVPMSLLNKVSI
jgi:hypothetical protein